jgi:hypothetical protein
MNISRNSVVYCCKNIVGEGVMYRFVSILFILFIFLDGCTCKSTKSTSSFYSNKAIAVWAYPDGVSVPYRDIDNFAINTFTEYNVNIGVIAYHATGIAKVDFSVDGGAATSVTSETINPETNEYEYVFVINTSGLSEGEHNISAIAYPNEGGETNLPNLKIQKDTATHNVIDVSGGGAALNTACQGAEGGDVIRIMDSLSYDLPDDTNYNFTKYVTIMPNSPQAPTITSGSLRSSYIKFKNIQFDLSATVNESVISSQYTHFWFDNCETNGNGSTVADNHISAFYFYNSSEYVVIENSRMHDTALGATVSSGNYIIRNNEVYDVTSDGFGYNGNNILITNNLIHNNKESGGGQHCDFISSNEGADQVVLRNNKCYDGDHQGIKLGGYNDGRYQPYSNIAIINNQFALGVNGSVNVRLEGITKGKYYTNVLIEYNTIWDGTSMFIIEDDVSASNVYFRNNILGPKAVASMSDFSSDVAVINNNCYNVSPATGDSSVTGDPLFTDSANWIFTLTSSSPCIDKADTSSGIFYDRNFTVRGSHPDMGAYEYP